MTQESPTRYGFRAVWREPGLMFAELAWRWAWGAATLLAVWFAAREFLASLDVSRRDEFQLGSGSPQLVADAILHIFQGSGPTMVRLFFILAPAALFLWIIAATLGRTATLRALVGGDARLLPRSLGLHVWRAAIGVLSFVGIVASFLLGAVLMARTDPPRPLIFMAVFFPLTVVFTVIRSRLNWFLLLGNIYAARGMRASEGIGHATHVFRRRSGEFMGVGTVVGALRLFLIGAVTFLDFALIPFVGEAPGWFLWTLFALITLAYFALSDWLYMVKLAAYARIIEDDARPVEPLLVAEPPAMPPPSIPPAPPAAIPSVPVV
jgi:hypothetical protein